MDREYFKQNICNPATFHGTVSHVFDIITNTVGATYGPGGTHNIFMLGPGEIKSSKDGLENLTMMKMDSSIARTVHQMAIEVAQRQATIVGDGTTSAVLIMAQVYKQLRENREIWKKYTPSSIYNAAQHIQRGIVGLLKNAASKIESKDDAFHLVYTSTDRNKELTDVIIEVYENLENFEDTNIVLDYSSSDSTYYSNTKGMTIKGRVINQAFNNYDIETCKLKNVEIIVVDGALTINNDIVDYANHLKLNGKSLLIICSGIKNENFLRFIEALSQRQPEYLHNMAVVYSTANILQDKDTFYDLIKSSGCAYLEEGLELTKETIGTINKGYAENVLIKDKKVTLAGFKQSQELDNHIKSIEDKILELEYLNENPNVSKDEALEAQREINRLKARIARLKHGTTTIFVGGDTTQRKTINYRLAEDGIKALQSALKTGFFAGCNISTMNVIYQLLIQQYKADPSMNNVYSDLLKIILKAYLEVYRKLISNRVTLSNDDEFFQYILTADAYERITINDNGNTVISVDTQFENHPVFVVVNLASDDEFANVIINPAATDILIVEQAIDSALVLATSNTIMTDIYNEWDATL